MFYIDKDIRTIKDLENNIIGYTCRRCKIFGHGQYMYDGWIFTKNLINPKWSQTFMNRRELREYLGFDKVNYIQEIETYSLDVVRLGYVCKRSAIFGKQDNVIDGWIASSEFMHPLWSMTQPTKKKAINHLFEKHKKKSGYTYNTCYR